MLDSNNMHMCVVKKLGIKNNNDQASFMLAALREIRSGGQKGHVEDDYGDEDVKPIIGPLMGVAIKGDNNPVQPPSDFTPPDVLEFVGLETDLSAGFLRLRWALLHTTSSFFKDAFLQEVLNYDKIEIAQWSSNENDIGLPKPRDGVDERSFLNVRTFCVPLTVYDVACNTYTHFLYHRQLWNTHI